MTVHDLLTALRAHGEVGLVQGRLRVRARQSALTSELRAEVSARKPELIAALEAEAAGVVARGRDIIADLAARGITVGLGAEGTPWAAPADLLEEGYLALLAAHREEVLAALRTAPAVGLPPDVACRHPHVVVSNGALECQRCDMRRPLPLADDSDAAPSERETHEQLVADGRDIIAALADRGITTRLDEEGRPWVAPSEVVDEADRALLAAHRDAVLAALGAEAAYPGPVLHDEARGQAAIDREYLSMVHIDVASDDPQVVDEIAAVLARHPGPDPVQLHFVVRGCEVVMQAGDRFRVAGGEALKAELDAHFEREVVRLEAVGPRPAPVDDGAGMPGVKPEAGIVHEADELAVLHWVPSPAGIEAMPRERSDAARASQPPAVLQGHLMATGGPVPGQEGRPASPGAEPTGGSQPGTVAPLALFDGSDAQRRDPEPVGAGNGGGEEPPTIEAGAQAFAVEPVLVATAAELEQALPGLLAEPVLGFDTEATGLDALTSRLRLIQLAARDRVYVVDAFRLDPRLLQPVLDLAQRLVGHNMKYDLRMLMAAGIRLPADIGRRISDTMLAGQLLGAELDGRRYRLADLAQRYLGVELDKTEQVSDWSGELTADQLAYAARDAAVLLPLRDHLRAELERARLNEVAGIEHRALPAMVWLEQTGAPFDQAAWLALADIAKERRRLLERELDAMAPSDSPPLPLAGLADGSSRWNSPAQVRRLLADRGVMLPDTRDETLHEHHDDDPLIPVLLQHREAAKLCGTYGREFLRFVHPVTGRIHADFFQLGSEAGRMSCVSSDTLVEMPRDLVAYPNGVPITEVRPGDWVYAFDWQRELVLRRVKWVAQTGVRRTVVITAENSDHHRITLRATPDHLIRLRNGDWRPAGSLMHRPGSPTRNDGPRLMAMVRRAVDDGYVKFFPHSVARYAAGTTGGGKNREHCWVLEKVLGRRISSKADVHHRDGNRANNHPANLEALPVNDHSGNRHIHPWWGNGHCRPGPDLYQGPTDYRVISVEAGLLEPVWDMEVEGDHNFIANGICVHNCARPNLQQVPHAGEYRACFRAPEGRVLVGADYSQIEPRIAAEISGEERLLAAYRDRRDVYRQVASELGVERSVAKTIVLGALYGLGARGLVRRLKADAGIVMAEAQARSYLDAFFAGYPALDRWRSSRRGDRAVATRTLSGRRRLRVEAYTQKVNTPIQGSAADIFKLAMALLHERRDVAPGAHLVLSVHDELVLEVDEAEAEVARHWLARCMREAGQVYLERVPVVVEVGVGATWAETKKTAAPVEEVDEWAA